VCSQTNEMVYAGTLGHELEPLPQLLAASAVPPARHMNRLAGPGLWL